MTKKLAAAKQRAEAIEHFIVTEELAADIRKAEAECIRRGLLADYRATVPWSLPRRVSANSLRGSRRPGPSTRLAFSVRFRLRHF